ncbi:MAG: hypothetical protein ACK56I_08740, partial [bacterium]
ETLFAGSISLTLGVTPGRIGAILLLAFIFSNLFYSVSFLPENFRLYLMRYHPLLKECDTFPLHFL